MINESIIDMNKQSLMTHLKDLSKTEIVVNMLKKHSNYNQKKWYFRIFVYILNNEYFNNKTSFKLL